jgi:hypothetical protein
MIETTIAEISALLELHNVPSYALTSALRSDEARMWDYLVSNELWGGAGTIADQALLGLPEARRQLDILLIKLGRQQIGLGRVNARTETWVTAFERWQSDGTR